MNLDDATNETRICDIIPEGYTLVEYTIQVKAMSPSGEVTLLTNRSPALSQWEALGMVLTHADGLKPRTHMPLPEWPR